MSPNIVKASYTGAKSKGRSAARLARYMEERRKTEPELELEKEQTHETHNGQERTRSGNSDDLYEKATTFGNREEFVSAAKERSAEGRRSAYIHVIVSPERGQGFTDEDFEKLIKPWTTDRHGNEKEYFAAVHRDSDHPHVHIAVAKDKFQKEELADLKRQTHERIRGRERFHEGERQSERGDERNQEREQNSERSSGPSDLERYARQGLREARYIGRRMVREAAREIKNELGGNGQQVQWGGYSADGPTKLKVKIGDREVQVYARPGESKREMMEQAREEFDDMRYQERLDREQKRFYADQDRMLEESKERRREEETREQQTRMMIDEEMRYEAIRAEEIEREEPQQRLIEQDSQHDPLFESEQERPEPGYEQEPPEPEPPEPEPPEPEPPEPEPPLGEEEEERDRVDEEDGRER